MKFSTEIAYPEQLSATERLRLIAVIAGGDRVADLEAENQQLRSRVDELEGNLRALKELLGGL